MIGQKIIKKDPYGSTTVDIESAHDDMYMYLRVSGFYFMLFSFGAGFFSGVGALFMLMRLI